MEQCDAGMPATAGKRTGAEIDLERASSSSPDCSVQIGRLPTAHLYFLS